MPVKVFWCKKMTFFKQTLKKHFFLMLVGDHVVKLNCFTVRDDFVAFPIDFFWGLPPSLYADEVLCAASRAALPPHILFGRRKNRKWRNSMQVGENAFLCNKYALPPHMLVVFHKIIDISLKNKWKKMQKNSTKKCTWSAYSDGGSLNFCHFWGLQNEPPKALRTPTWLQKFS